MLRYVRENSVEFVIVHKVDRLARNRADDVEITLALQAAGATLVSCTESIDETPSGILLHGIMSSIAEFYSRNLANEVMKGLVQKAKAGGTPMKAPLGYRNVRLFEQGREIRTVEIDAVRGPLIAWAFEAYATGDWTQRRLLEELTRRGLDVPANRAQPAKPLSLSYIQYMLINPYYKGTVRYRGVDYEGRHEPLVSERTLAARPRRPRREERDEGETPQAPALPQGRPLRPLRQPDDRHPRPQPHRPRLSLLRLQRPPPKANRLHDEGSPHRPRRGACRAALR